MTGSVALLRPEAGDPVTATSPRLGPVSVRFV
jgi:hypothetical protein